MELTLFDFIIFGIITFFALIGLMRGLVKEIFSIANWVIASVVTIYLRPVISNLILMKINIPIVADLISNSFLFTTTLIFISIITSNIARNIKNIFPISINVFFGFIFGTVKGYILSALIFAIILNIYGDKTTQPDWFTMSKSYEPLSIGADVMKPFTDSLFGSLSEEKSKKPAKKTDEPEEIEDNDSDYPTQPSKKNSSTEETGYKKEQIKKMDRLIETISDN